MVVINSIFDFLAAAVNYAGAGILLIWFYWLFARSQNQLTTEQNNNTAGWLFGSSGLRANWVSQFQIIFEKIFSEKHFSIRCLIASIASTAFLSAVVYSTLYMSDFGELSSDFNRQQVAPIGPLTAPILLFLPLNILADFLSLWQTRLFIKFASTRGILLRVLLIPADIAATSLIFFLITLPAVWLFGTLGWYYDISSTVSGLIEGERAQGLVCRYTIFFFVGSFLTSFLTTAWYLIYALGAFVVRLLFIGNEKVNAVGEIMGLGKKPVQAIGRAGAATLFVFISLIVLASEIAPVASLVAEIGMSSGVGCAFGWVDPVFADSFAWVRDEVLCME